MVLKINPVQDRVRGVLMGLAAGDRIGGPVTMATLLGESLIENSGYKGQAVENKYIDWWKSDGFDTGIVSDKVFGLVAGGMHIVDAVSRAHIDLLGMTGGCNPAHRNAPLAMSAHIPDENLGNFAQQESLLTHKHPVAGLVSAFSARLIRSLIRGIEWSIAVQTLAKTAEPEVSNILDASRRGDICSDGYSPHVLAAAIYFVDSSNTFDVALDRAIRFSGAENYSAVLAGSLGGARWGALMVSDTWFDETSELEKIKLVADKLACDWE